MCSPFTICPHEPHDRHEWESDWLISQRKTLKHTALHVCVCVRCACTVLDVVDLSGFGNVFANQDDIISVLVPRWGTSPFHHYRFAYLYRLCLSRVSSTGFCTTKRCGPRCGAPRSCCTWMCIGRWRSTVRWTQVRAEDLSRFIHPNIHYSPSVFQVINRL